jgi:hypothetical protein
VCACRCNIGEKEGRTGCPTNNGNRERVIARTLRVVAAPEDRFSRIIFCRIRSGFICRIIQIIVICLVLVGPPSIAFDQRGRWTVCRFQDYFNARPQPPGLSGTRAYTLPYQKNLERLHGASAFLVLVVGLRPRPRIPLPLVSRTRTRDEGRRR